MDLSDELIGSDYMRRRGIRAADAAARSDARITRVRRGVYTRSERWDELHEAEQYRLFVVATVAGMRAPAPIVCGPAAAALWGLPAIGAWPTTVDVAVEVDGGGSSGLVRRHRLNELPPTREVDGIRVTSPARTVVDLARTCQLVSALAGADAALRANLCTITELDRELAAVPPRARGREGAANVVHLADERSESPGESLSRARMWELGLPQPRLQVPLRDQDGAFGRADFGWEGIIGEFDGKTKYGMQGVNDSEVSDVLWREKRREDRIRRQSRVVRWTWDDALRSAPMARLLAEAGICPSTPRQPWVRGEPAITTSAR